MNDMCSQLTWAISAGVGAGLSLLALLWSWVTATVTAIVTFFSGAMGRQHASSRSGQPDAASGKVFLCTYRLRFDQPTGVQSNQCFGCPHASERFIILCREAVCVQGLVLRDWRGARQWTRAKTKATRTTRATRRSSRVKIDIQPWP